MALPIVVLDPGHGGRRKVGGSSPNNARGANGLLERDLTLDIALRVRSELKGNAEVRLTRNSDVNLSLADRAAVARAATAAVFVSIHFNGSDDSKVDGTEAWVGKGGASGRHALAKQLVDQVAHVAGLRRRGVFTRDLGVIRADRHAAVTDACLLEVSFLSNPKQAARLAGEAYKALLAQAVATAIRGHLQGVCLPPPATSHAASGALGPVGQGRQLVSCPVLSTHAAANNLALRWTVPAERPAAVDVVVHLHGFVGKGQPLGTARQEAISGLELEQRARATLGLVPVGRKTGVLSKDGRSDVVDFPALLTGDGLNRTVRWALDWYGREQLGGLAAGSLAVDRLLLTAHSGGGARLLKLLAAGHDPHELHLFDCFYEAPDAASAWAERHIATDAAMLRQISNPNDWLPYMCSRGGALCCAWDGTGTASSQLGAAVERALARVGDAAIRALLRRHYRVLRAGMGHNAIPAAWGPVLLADATASPPARAGSHALDGSAADLRQRIADTALTEYERWDRGRRRETDPAMSETLRGYWATGTGRAVSKAEVRDAAWQEDNPWSAAFLSWVMHTAGAGTSFDYAAAHASYIASAKQARAAGDATRFQAWRIDEAVPEVGDLVCKDRKVCVERDAHGRCTRHACSGTSFDNVVRGRSSHSDVVVEVDAARKRIRTIGGNVGQSVDHKWIDLTAEGRLPERASDGCRWIAILKPPASTPALAQATAAAWAGPLDAGGDEYLACLREVKGMRSCPAVPPLCMRPRPAQALPGSEAIRLPAIWGEREPTGRGGWAQRDEALLEQIVGGNLPEFLRRFVPVTVNSADGRHSITYHVMPDYVAVGSDADHVSVPLGGPMAERLADALGCILPTAKMVWDIHQQAVHVPLEPRNYAGAKDQATKLKQASTWAYEEYSRAIQRSIERALAAAGKARGALVAGHRKDVVIGTDLPAQRDKLLFFGGWLRNRRKDGSWQAVLQGRDGGFGQTGPHFAFYADYSHGVRLVSRAVTVDGQARDIGTVLKDKELCGMLLHGGPLDLHRARYGAPAGGKAQTLGAGAPAPEAPVAQRVVAETTREHGGAAPGRVALPAPGSGIDTLQVNLAPGLKFSHWDIELLQATPQVQATVEAAPPRGSKGAFTLRVRWSHPALGRLQYRLRVYGSADGRSAPQRVLHGSPGMEQRSRALLLQDVPVEMMVRGEKARVLHGALALAQKRAAKPAAADLQLAKAADGGASAAVIAAVIVLGIAAIAAVVASLGLFVLFGILTEAMRRGYNVRDTKFKMGSGSGQARQEHELAFNLTKPGSSSDVPTPAPARDEPAATPPAPGLVPPIPAIPGLPGLPGVGG
jgi:N-acetylmuramoyl-L-alanine amidase